MVGLASVVLHLEAGGVRAITGVWRRLCSRGHEILGVLRLSTGASVFVMLLAAASEWSSSLSR